MDSIKYNATTVVCFLHAVKLVLLSDSLIFFSNVLCDSIIQVDQFLILLCAKKSVAQKAASDAYRPTPISNLNLVLFRVGKFGGNLFFSVIFSNITDGLNYQYYLGLGNITLRLPKYW